jgi:hypothetical protein
MIYRHYDPKRKTKPATEAQKNARERNWNKAQLLCLDNIARRIYRCETTTDLEKNELDTICNHAKRILINWEGGDKCEKEQI